MFWLKNIHLKFPHAISSHGEKTSSQKSHAWAPLMEFGKIWFKLPGLMELLSLKEAPGVRE